MNTTNARKWVARAAIFFLLWCVGMAIVCLFFNGCDYESPEVRFVSGIVVYSIDGTQYDEVRFRGENIVDYCAVRSAAAFTYADGSIVEAGGLRFEPTAEFAEYFVRGHDQPGYWVDTEGAGVRSSMVTEESGYCEFAAWNGLWGVYMSQSGMSARGKRTDAAPVAAGGFQNWTDPRTGFSTLIPWYDNVYVPGAGWVTGGHYKCAGAPHQGTVSHIAVRPQPVAGITAMQSPGSTAFLKNTALGVPETGFSVSGSEWCMRVGPNGQGYGRQVDHLTALEHSDTATLQFRATPYYLSVQVVCAEPVDASVIGASLDCVLRCGVVERGISAAITAVSDDGLRVIAQTDYIIPIDSRDFDASTIPTVLYDRWTCPADANDVSADIYAPLFLEFCDPNVVNTDPNNVNEAGVFIDRLDGERYVPVHCVPIESGQRITVEFSGHFPASLVLYVAEHWLTGNRTLDINNDGIVNMRDCP